MFCQFIHDGAVSSNKHEHKAFGMQFSCRRFTCNNVVTLSFRKSLSSKSNVVSALVEEACDEVIDKVLNEMFSQSVQDLVARKVSNELSADCVPCDMCQGDKSGSSAVG